MGIGDDCAVLEPTPGRQTLVTTDMLMDGRHFRLEEHGAEAAGYKALAVNLSDIAAMAGIPTAAFVAVALPQARAAEIARGLHAGMMPLVERFGIELAGGDTNAWDGPLVISVTVLGEATERGPVLRSGARPGDVVFVTGALGGSLLGRHLHPEPRVAEALTLHEHAALHAAIDLSDGLLSDLGHILDESHGLGAILDRDAIPVHSDAHAMARRDGRTPLDHALNDGEDFELCLVVPPEAVAGLEGANLVIHRVGEVVAEQGIRLRASDGSMQLCEPRGFDHFRT